MGGVVRRDGLREEGRERLAHALWDIDAKAKAHERDERPVQWHGAGRAAQAAFRRRADELSQILDAVPDVPPDPPAVDRDELARVLEKCWSNREGVAASGREHCAAFADALLSGVLVDAADVRARALEDAADELPLPGRTISRAFLLRWLRDRAVSEREGTT